MHTERRNVNRGYMKLEVWNDAQELCRQVDALLRSIGSLDLRLRSQVLDSAHSIPANIAEGYCRRTVNEYLQFLNVALGSAGELMSRVIGLKEARVIDLHEFEEFDKKHYEVENKLLNLVKAVQAKRREGTWIQELHEPLEPYA